MKRLMQVLSILILGTGCATPKVDPVPPPQPSVEKMVQNAKTKITKRILLLAPQCIDPNADTVGFNSLVERMTQAYSEKLQPILKAAGKDPIYVLDQQIKYTNGEKLAIHSVKNSADAAIVMTIETPQKAGEFSIYLRIQYFDLHYIYQAGKTVGAIPSNEIVKSYLS